MMNGSFSGYIPFPENTLFGILRQLNLDSPIYPRGITSNGAILTQAAVDVHTNYSNQVKNNYQIRAPSSLNSAGWFTIYADSPEGIPTHT